MTAIETHTTHTGDALRRSHTRLLTGQSSSSHWNRPPHTSQVPSGGVSAAASRRSRLSRRHLSHRLTGLSRRALVSARPSSSLWAVAAPRPLSEQSTQPWCLRVRLSMQCAARTQGETERRDERMIFSEYARTADGQRAGTAEVLQLRDAQRWQIYVLWLHHHGFAGRCRYACARS